MNSLGRGEGNKDKSRASVITRETIGMTLLLFGVVVFFIAVTGRVLFGDPGAAITAFFLGLFGIFFYPLDIFLIFFGVTLVAGKKPVSGAWLARGLFLLVTVFFIVHIATSERFFGSYGEYLKGCWTAATSSAASATGGGVIFGVIVYPFRLVLTAAGAYVIFSLLMLFALFLILWATPLKGIAKRFFGGSTPRSAESGEPKNEPSRAVEFEDLSVPDYHGVETAEPAPAPTPTPTTRYTHYNPVRAAKEESKDILFSGDPASSYRKNLIFSNDSQFNTFPRRSSVVPHTTSGNTTVYGQPAPSYTAYEPPKPDYSAPRVSDPESVQPAALPDEPSAPSYSERYLNATEQTRTAIPRRITPAEKISPASESDAIRTPSYRAPSAPAPVQNDFYSRDVEPEEKEEPGESVTPLERFAIERKPEPKPAEPEKDELPGTRTGADLFRRAFSSPVQSDKSDRQSAVVNFRDVARELPKEEPAPREEFRRTRFGFGSEPEEKETDEPKEEPRRFGTAEPSGTVTDEARFSRRPSAADMFDEPDIDDADYREANEENDEEAMPTRTTRSIRDDAFGDRGGRGMLRTPPPAPVPDAPAPQPKKHIYRPYVRPGIDLFARYDESVSISQEEIDRNCAVIVETFAGFRVEVEVKGFQIGPKVTRYDIDIPGNVPVPSVIKREAEIAMRLHASGVNIYNNTQRGCISIEVPNSKSATVGLRPLLVTEEFLNSKSNSLVFAIGKNIDGSNIYGNIVKMKHVLVAGTTGSGKSVCLNAMLMSLICRYSPEELRLILIDPKKVEFTIYDGLPHLMINEIISDAQKAVTALNWSIKEMERRYSLFEQKTRNQGINVHNLDEYNKSLTEDEERLPKIVIVVDELADLMSAAKKDIEDRIQRLAQKARASGIHLVIATQRPSVDVITGVIKSNLPTRIAFRLISEVDSRTILDESGAEKLLGNGDMLYRTEGMFSCMRVQGAYLDSAEVQAVIKSVKENNEAYFDESVADYINKTNSSESSGDGDPGDSGSIDPQYIKALAIVVKLGTASISLIQRKCSVGYNHAGKIMEWMEMMGYVSAFDGKAKARTVLLSKEDFESKYGGLD